ncbi:amino acid transporter-like protein [Pseudovirgaria hyperparasitica]|uniref:Amino acid transporter-like protein n=1 Tax=Pseudovirgaria hyperparasitica TaxID=470096 RepID=A0A6A6W525_9PEZI|nr:amino acid transporter-like protein [Pseudovirgaria hyperparasitica]KAF2757056.1 amino acid transporter-like protein [Pseudovirgaria hyperparasitica]
MSSQPKEVPASRSSPAISGRASPAGSFLRTSLSQSHIGTPQIPQIPLPSHVASAASSETQTPLPELDISKSSVSGPSESALANALKDSFGGGGTPPQMATPPLRPFSPVRDAELPGRGPSSNYGSFDHRRTSSPAPYQDPEIIRRHLVGPSNNSPSNTSVLEVYGSPRRGRGSDAGNGKTKATFENEEEFSSLQLQGGDITRQIYRWTEQQEAEARGQYKRSKSFHSERPKPDDTHLNIETIKQPGGFRRNYLRRAAASPSPGPSTHHAGVQSQPLPQPFTSNFLEFLSLYGHFAGEELEEDDEALGPDEYFSSYTSDQPESDDDDHEYGERSALLTPGGKRRKRKTKIAGKGSPTGAAMLLLKSFVGTGVLFLPRAYLNGGMAFSNVVLLATALLSYYCFILLVTTRLKVEHSFGDMGLHLYGKWMKNLINFSLVLSQIGFSSAYTVFVAENLQAFVLAVSDCKTNIDIKYMILMQMIIFLPLSLYRNINNIQKLALIADIFIVLGLIYLYYYDILTIVGQGGIADIRNFNSKNWTLFIGTAIFTFEGIGLVIPIQTGMKHPSKFPKVLGIVMIIITVIFLSMGALSYAAYGSKTETVIILNMPQDNKMVNGVQFIYSLAILLSTPLQIYPAIEITSQQLFSRTGKYNPYVKWKKNIFRFFMVMVCATLAWAGAGDLDKFVALVGSFACIPLVYIYPPLLHLKAIAQAPWRRVSDVLIVIFGFLVMAYTTALTVAGWVNSGEAKAPTYCESR